jgi:aryl-alcohol dehydrogenase-like predicted oxidoreductase
MYNKISFGTASLGLENYGINSQRHSESDQYILQNIIDKGIQHIDTAPGYGNAEVLVGKAISNLSIKNKPKLYTKISSLSVDTSYSESHIIESIMMSKRKLQVDSLDVVYLHQNQISIFSDTHVISGMKMLKSAGHAREIGVSVYSHDELIAATELGVYDWVQVPANIFDISFVLAADKIKKTNIAVRSVFLQGALFCAPEAISNLPDSDYLLEIRRQYQKICDENNISITRLSLSFLNQLDSVNQIIIGSRSLDLWDKLGNSLEPLPESIFDVVHEIASSSKKWTNPRTW